MAVPFAQGSPWGNSPTAQRELQKTLEGCANCYQVYFIIIEVHVMLIYQNMFIYN